jgi:hypothetical protein
MKTVRFIENAVKVHGNKYSYTDSIYESIHKKLDIICPEHGKFSVTPANHVNNGSGCPQCSRIFDSKNKTHSLDKFIEKARRKHGDRYDYSLVKYVNAKTKVEITCPDHGSFWQEPNSHTSTGVGCPECGLLAASIKLRGSNDDFVDRSKIIHGSYNYETTEYINTNTKVEITCPEHGSFWQTPSNHLHLKHGCPKCVAVKESNGEKELVSFVMSLTSEEVILHDRSLLGRSEVDIYIPSLKVAFEYNGMYWHSDIHDRITRNYHYNKWKQLSDQGIRLISVYENVWKDRNDQIKSIIRNALGTNPDKVAARKCDIKRIDNGRQFFIDNHIQGYARSSDTYGLFYGDNLVAALSISKPRFRNDFDWEIIRFATNLNTTVIGGYSRLLNHVFKMHPGSYISYSNNDYYTGSTYQAAGFENVGQTGPGYFYWKGGSGIPFSIKTRFQARNRDKSIPEDVYMKSVGYLRIFDCGNTVWTKEKAG